VDNVTITKAKKEDAAYIREKLKKYLLDSTDADWDQFFVVKSKGKTVAFGRVIDHGDYFELASLGVDYYHRGKGIGKSITSFLIEEARRKDPARPIYLVTHRPGFFKKLGFDEVIKAPSALEYKRDNKCRLHPSRIKIMRLI